MKLSDLKILFVDCQTTGMRPPSGHLLDIAWALNDEPTVDSLAQLPEGVEISRKVTELTGIKAENLKVAKTLSEIYADFQSAATRADLALIHYAQFEKPFLADLYSRSGQEFLVDVFCSQGLSKKLLPNLPSHNIRAVAGYFGYHLNQVQRAKSHVDATKEIWRNLLVELHKHEIDSLENLREWLISAPKTKSSRYEYRIDKLKRLELPDQPGIYRMIAKNGEVLYVGKATSLKSRVNSYFRGQKNRNKQKLELLAQVWDLRVTGCATPLEAALMETDEIKRYNPRYNLVLKRGTRYIVFYDREFTRANKEQNSEFTLGPFRNFNWIETLRDLAYSLKNEREIGQIFFEPIEHELVQQGFALFTQTFHAPKLNSIRKLLAFGLHLIRIEAEDVEEKEDTENLELTPEDVAGKFERLLKRAANEYIRGKHLTKLLDARVVIQTKNGPKDLNFHHGQLGGQPCERLYPWQGLGIDDFDRMSILRSEMDKCEGRIIRY